MRALSWDATAHASVGGRELSLIARTRIELPVLSVRSASRLATDSIDQTRTMILQPDGAWLEVSGKRVALPPQLAIHERQQYAIYALLVLAQAQPRPRSASFDLSAPPYPPIRFVTGGDGYPISATLTVEAPESDAAPIMEHVTFSGRLDSNGVRWPRRITIAQNGAPYFELTITRFEAIVA